MTRDPKSKLSYEPKARILLDHIKSDLRGLVRIHIAANIADDRTVSMSDVHSAIVWGVAELVKDDEMHPSVPANGTGETMPIGAFRDELHRKLA